MLGYVNQKKQLIEKSKNKPCADCHKKFHLVVMEFDHLPQFEKSFTISQSGGVSLAELAAEIAKCEVVCANCRRVRSFQRHRDACARGKSGRPDTQFKQAVEWLTLQLQDGKPKHGKQLILQARTEANISEETLRKAQQKIGMTFKYGFLWYWRLKSSTNTTAPELFTEAI